MAAYLLYRKRLFASFYQEGKHYCTAHKYSTETAIDASRIINKFDHYYM